MKKFIKHDPHGPLPAFSPKAMVEIKARDGRQYIEAEPWMLVGWNHTGSKHDILEYRMVKGSMSKVLK